MKDFNSLIKKAKEERASTFAIIQEMGKKERKDWTSEDHEKFERAYSDMEKKSKDIQSLEIEEKALTMMVEKQVEKHTDDDKRYSDAFEVYLRKGEKALNQEQREMIEKRVQSSTNSEGGYLIPTLWADMITKRAVEIGPMLQVGQMITSDSGAAMEFPTNDDSANEGEWLAEKSAANDQDTVFGSIEIATHLWDSKAIIVQKQLLQDNGFNLESYLAEILGERKGRGLNTAFTTGNGDGKPYGVVTGAGVNLAAAAAAAISRTDIVGLKYAVNRAYHSQASFMCSAGTMKKIVLLTIGSADDRPLYIPSTNVGEPDRLEGNPIYVNPAMADVAASAVSMIFGDFKKYVIRHVPSAMSMLRLEELYAKYYQVAFIMFERFGGRLRDVYAIGKLTHPTT